LVSGNVPSGASKAFDESGFDWIANKRHHNRDLGGRPLRGECRARAFDQKHVDLLSQQVVDSFRSMLGTAMAMPPGNRDIMPFDVSEFAQPAPESLRLLAPLADTCRDHADALRGDRAYVSLLGTVEAAAAISANDISR
jgi:hypothetical protein